MKTSVLSSVLLAVILGLITLCSPLLAQSSAPAGIDENTRLMQEYMTRRAEWVALRRAALDKAKDAKSAAEKKQHLDKLAEDEKPVLARMGEAARAYQAAEKAKRPAAPPAPTTPPRG